MEAAIRLWVGGQPISSFVFLSRLQPILVLALSKIVVVEEVAPSVIWRVDVDQIHGVQVGFLKELKRLQILTLDKDIPGFIEIDAVIANRTKSAGGLFICLKN